MIINKGLRSTIYLFMLCFSLLNCNGGGDSSTTSTTPSTYSISGSITASSVGVQGVTMTLSSTSSATATTDANGNYSFTKLANGSYTVTPTMLEYTFTPSSKSVAVSSANVTAQDFIATLRVPKLPDTGQTTHYSSAFGDDANYVINAQSFTDNGDGTVTDNVTVLMWEQSATHKICTYADAVSYCNNLTIGGYTDWKLPRDLELMSIVDYGKRTPAIDSTYFPGTYSTQYWTSSPMDSDSSHTWTVDFQDGYVNDFALITDHRVRCVRGNTVFR